ncbi:hypothetical protein LAZ67_4002882 [Cordylochernes scorpioides]|uniref:Transposase Tc1-like domain-containing protein n=1 Tax=Cordylochernes scorpioides TaxID=51811 RepID=A0ABY6KDF2_9ARAC|nr:hypothetical protein LAZ67_4002882 [Cordylochernes scorpioides]
MPGHRKRRQFKQTDAFTRGMVIGLKRAGWSICQIAADTHLGASTVHRLWRRWLEQGNVAIYRNAGATRVTSARVDRRILRQAVAAPQATCTAILQHVQDTLDHSISTRTISRRLVANGLHSCRPLRRLPLTPPNRRQRLEWCRARSTWMTEWHRVVFSDESRFCLSSDSRRVRVWRRRGERSNPAAIVERPTVRQRGIMILVNEIPEQTNSKRHLLSHISRIFDPIGWLSPVIIRLKILLQSLWKQKLNWDDPLPDTLCSPWKKIEKELSVLNKIQIPRYFSCRGALLSVELHGFCDSSEVAYAAVFYIRSHFKSGQVKVSLIASKTRVAPLKMISIPRLELCAALLLATLYDTIHNSLCLQIDRLFLWTDSKIVLSWIKSESRHWKPFVGNRIADVQRLTLLSSWHYVISKDNPADCASRAIHIEVVSDLSSAAFLAALKRFISRRGKPSDIFSDNRTNFRGANNILREQFDILKASTIQKFKSNERIKRHFIPPFRPKFRRWQSKDVEMEEVEEKRTTDPSRVSRSLRTKRPSYSRVECPERLGC